MKALSCAVIAAATLAFLPIARTDAATSYTLVTEPAQGFQTVYNFINSAQHTIDMTMYELSDTTVEDDLAAATAKGVTVRVILDQNLEKSANTAAYNYLSSNGVSVHWANTTYHATHQKTITIDSAYSDAETAIMTANLTPQYYTTTRDFVLYENDANDISAIESTFNSDFTNATVTPPTGDDLVWSPTNAQTALLGVINGATTSLQIENEEMSDTAVVSALESAAERGVNVQVIMTNTSNDYETEFNALGSAGVYVSTYASTASLYIHAKVILADYGTSAAKVFVGSENFSSDSLTSNRELGLIMNDSATMTSLNTTLTSDFNGGTLWSTSPQSGFSLTASPSSLTVAQGANGVSTITVNKTGSFSSSVSLAASGLPSGVTASFSPSSTTTTSTLTLTASSTAAAGTYSITVTGTSGSTSHTTTVSLTVTSTAQANFSLSASPSSVSVAQGSNVSSTITVTPSNGFTGSVALTASGLPSGVTASFSPASTTSTSTLTLTASSTATTGAVTVTITGTSGSLTQTTTVSLTVNSTGGGSTQLLSNPGFENGSSNPSPWVLAATVKTTSGIINDSSKEPPHSGTWDAWLCGYGVTNTASIYQQVAIPSGKSTATLTFWLHIDTAETTKTTAYDTLNVEVRNSSGTVLATLGTFSNLNHNTGYTQESYNLSSYIGQTVQIYLIGSEDSEDQTSFVVDDFALNVQ